MDFSFIIYMIYSILFVFVKKITYWSFEIDQEFSRIKIISFLADSNAYSHVYTFSVFLSTGLKYNIEFLLFCKYDSCIHLYNILMGL